MDALNIQEVNIFYLNAVFLEKKLNLHVKFNNSNQMKLKNM